MRMALLSVAFAVFYGSSLAQNISSSINEHVWKPFIKGYNELDNEGFMAVHSKDLVRAPRDSRRVMNFEEYAIANERSNERAIAKKEKRRIELRFLERIANSHQAYEVGIYRVTITSADGKTTDFYGKFHVVLRKENGVWKILVDADSTEGETIDGEEFDVAEEM